MRLPARFSAQFGLSAAAGVALALGVAAASFAGRIDDLSRQAGAELSAAVESELRRGAEALLARFAAEVAPDLLASDREALARAAAAARARSGVLALRVYDPQGRLLASAGAPPPGGGAPQALRAAGPGEPARWREGRHLGAGLPVCLAETCLGSVAALIEAEAARRQAAALETRLEAAERRAATEAALAGAAALGLAGLGAAAFGFRAGRRLDRSVRAAADRLEKIAAGAPASPDPAAGRLVELAEAVERVAAAMAAARAEGPELAAEASAALADMADGLFVARVDGEMVVANEALHALFGAERLIGEDAFALFGLSRAQDAERFAAALTGLTELPRGDGGRLPVTVSARASRDGGAIAAKVVGVVRDATDIAEQRAAFEAAEARAEAAERARGEFLSVVSHELRTPLNGILGGAAVLAGGELNPSQRTFVDIVQKSGKALLATVSDMLNLAQIETGEAEVVEGPVDLHALAQEIAAAVAAEAEAKALELFVHVQPDAPAVVTDRDKLLDIGAALAGNAVKFTEEGHVAIRIGAEVAEGRATVALSVTDTGCGVDPDKLDAIFDRFTQSDSSTIRRHGGSGLGLAIAKKLADLLGGELSVESRLGEGATFTLRLDAAVDRSDEAEARERVLVAAEAGAERARMARTLAASGAEVLEASSAAEAQALLESGIGEARPIELVAHSADLPGFAGSELEQALRGPGARTASLVYGSASAAAALGGAPPQAAVVEPDAPAARIMALAREAVRAAKETVGANAPGAAAAEPAKAAGPLLLLAERSANGRIVIGAFLKRIGFELRTAESGYDAVKLARELRPAAVVLDVALPVMGGVDAARAIRRGEAERGLPPCPIIGLVEPREGALERCAAAGMTDVVLKPVKLEELRARLARWSPEAAALRAPGGSRAGP